jgi:hypothetical protein
VFLKLSKRCKEGLDYVEPFFFCVARQQRKENARAREARGRWTEIRNEMNCYAPVNSDGRIRAKEFPARATALK